jgi:molybdenum cofactor guanylyltransferase
MVTAEHVTGLILAGGAGKRFAGQDKGLVELQGKPLVQWVLEGLAPQCQTCLVSANRNQTRYSQYGYPVITDVMTHFQGPLAGIASALPHVKTPWVLTVPGDTPLVAPDLRVRLAQGLHTINARIAIAVTNGQSHPLHALLPVTCLTGLNLYLASGQRCIQDWLEEQSFAAVPFDDQADHFANLNSQRDLEILNQRLQLEHELTRLSDKKHSL